MWSNLTRNREFRRKEVIRIEEKVRSWRKEKIGRWKEKVIGRRKKTLIGRIEKEVRWRKGKITNLIRRIKKVAGRAEKGIRKEALGRARKKERSW